MTRNDLRRLAVIRIREAKVLLKAGHYDGAYYFIGLSVECALKTCIAKKTRRHDFPDKRVVDESWTHDLKKLIRTADLDLEHARTRDSDPRFAQNWTLVKEWKVGDRYAVNRPREQAIDLYDAVAARTSGVLKWIKRHW